MTTTCQHCAQPVDESNAVLDGASLDDAAYHLPCYFTASRAMGEPVWCGDCNQPVDTPADARIDHNTVIHADDCPTDDE